MYIFIQNICILIIYIFFRWTKGRWSSAGTAEINPISLAALFPRHDSVAGSALLSSSPCKSEISRLIISFLSSSNKILQRRYKFAGMVSSRQSLPSWISAAAVTRVDIEGNVASSVPNDNYMPKQSDGGEFSSNPEALSNVDLGVGERAFAAAGAAFISAIIVNPLDVAKVFFFFFKKSI